MPLQGAGKKNSRLGVVTYGITRLSGNNTKSGGDLKSATQAGSPSVSSEAAIARNRLRQTRYKLTVQSFVLSVAKIKCPFPVDRPNRIFTLYSYTLPYKVFYKWQCSNVSNPNLNSMKKIYRNWGILLISLFVLGSVPLYGQNVNVNGTVTDDAGAPLPGVSVLEKGTANGATTDVDGKYTIQVQGEGATLVFSFIGFQTQEIEVNNRSTIDL